MVTYAPPETFKRRADFLRLAARGQKFARPGFVMQLQKTSDSAAPLRVGYTATRKIGNAVIRNRARRRLKEAARLTLATMQISGVELVLICRRETADLPFQKLCAGLKTVLAEAIK